MELRRVDWDAGTTCVPMANAAMGAPVPGTMWITAGCEGRRAGSVEGSEIESAAVLRPLLRRRRIVSRQLLTTRMHMPGIGARTKFSQRVSSVSWPYREKTWFVLLGLSRF